MTDNVPMPPDSPMRQVGAVWCDEHGRWECSRKSRRSQSRCHGAAIRGLASCRMHSGVASSLAKAQGEVNLAAWSLAATETDKPIDLTAKVLQLISMTGARVEVYAELLRVQVEDQDYEGLVGVTYTAGHDGAKVETGDRPRGLAKLEGEERDRLMRYVKAAHDMGIAERHIELAQGQAAQVVAAARAGLDALGAELLPASRDAFLKAFLNALGPGRDTVPGELV